MGKGFIPRTTEGAGYIIRRTLRGAFLLATGMPLSALAQITAPTPTIAPPEPAGQVAEIVVTANKREEKRKDVAMSITALSGAKLDRQQNLGFDDYVSQVPGLSLQSNGPTSELLTLRGLNAGGNGATVGIYIDETPVGSSNALLLGAITTSNIDTWDISRVEVLRGPQGTLYGASTEGGLIKFVTNAPDPRGFDAAVEVGGQGVKGGELAGSIKGMVNLPFLSGKAALRVSGFEEQLPGFIGNPLLGARNTNGGDKYGFRASLLYKPVEAVTLRATWTNQEIRVGGNPDVDVVGDGGNPSAPPANQFDPAHGNLVQERLVPERQKILVNNYAFQADYDFGRSKLTSITSYALLKSSSHSDASFALFAPGVTNAQASESFYGQPVAFNPSLFIPLHKFTQEVRLNSKPSSKIEAQIGFYYTRESGATYQEYPYLLLPGGTPAGNPPGLNIPLVGNFHLQSVYREYAAFGDVTYYFTPALDLQIGGRYSQNDQDSSEGYADSLLFPQTSNSDQSSDHSFTYSVAPRWHIDQNSLLYARIASGYRPGGPNNLPYGAADGVPRTYGPDKTVNYEVGFRSELFDRRLSIDVAAFLIDWSSIQLTEVVNRTVITGNGGSARSRGVEWSFAATPIVGLNLTLVGAYVDALLTSPAPGVGGLSGDRLPYAPSLSGSLDGDYSWKLLPEVTAFVGGTFSVVGDRDTDFSTDALYAHHVTLPEYETVNLRAGLEKGRYRLEVYARNVADVRGLNDYSSGGASGFSGTASIIQPRTVGVVVSARFK